MEVIDNFLPEYQFQQISNVVLSDYFPWYWNEGVVSTYGDFKNPKSYQLTHTIFNIRENGICSTCYSLFDVVQQKLRVDRLDRIKLNLNPKTIFHRKGVYHVDNTPSDSYQHTKTAVLYLNTNNGYTQFKKGGKVKSVANRIVIFGSNQEHTGVTCTDKNRRVVINFNYDGSY